MRNDFEQFNIKNSDERTEKNIVKDQEEKEYIENYLTAVGLDWEDLENKKVLEIGAGLASFAQEAKKKNIDVTSLEKNPGLWEDEGQPSQETPYIQSDASELPFKEESFDYIFSKAAPPIISSNKKEVKHILKEAERVLKEGGEFHFGPADLDASIFSEEELNKEVDGIFQDINNTKERKKIIKNKSIEFLKSINSNIDYHQKKKKSKSGKEVGFYVLKKVPKEKEGGS